MTQAEYVATLAKLAAKPNRLTQPINGQPVSSEADLHEQILELSRSKGWLVVHSRMDKRSTVPVGTPDFIIFMRSAVLCVECKSRQGKCSPNQKGTLHWLKCLGHHAIEARHLQEVLAAISEIEQEVRMEGRA